jgi:hypothetical protein
MIRIFLVALVLLVAGGDVLAAQSRDRRGMQEGPVERLMRFQGELALSPAQIGRLQEIDDRMDRQNQPLVAQLSVLRRQMRALGPPERLSPEARVQYQGHVGEFRRLMRQIEGNNHAAMKEVGAVLTQSQKESLRTLLRDHHNREQSNRRPAAPARN